MPALPLGIIISIIIIPIVINRICGSIIIITISAIIILITSILTPTPNPPSIINIASK